LVLFSTYEFGMVEVADALTSGSSIMPQKKNPCLAELARSRTGEMYGCLLQGLTMMKALISGYNRDIQEDKPPLWRALDLAEQTLTAVAAMVSTMELRVGRMRELAGANFATATELANWLVSDRGLPFRRCHEIVGTIVRRLIDEGETLGNRRRVAALLAGFGVKAKVAELGFLDPLACLERQRSRGSTGPEETRRLHALLAKEVGSGARAAAARRRRIETARRRTQKAVTDLLTAG
jgi:argininosuccinate lyase